MSRVPERQRNWPPRSPHEALLTSPSGRKRLESRLNRDASPSPTKRPQPTSRLNALHKAMSEDEDEDDEETLQLKLQEIQAQLKLKKLQQAKARKAAQGSSDTEQTRTSTHSRRAQSPAFTVQIPVSPTHDKRAPKLPPSPARVLLGIDKGLRAQDVSLKRAASFSTRLEKTRADLKLNPRPTSQQGGDGHAAPRGKSFSEKLIQIRDAERERNEKQERVLKSRSSGFGFNKKDQHGVSDMRTSSQQSMHSQGQQPNLRQGFTKSSDALSRQNKDASFHTSSPSISTTLTGRSETSMSSQRSLASRSSENNLRSFRSRATSPTTQYETEPDSAVSIDPSLFESFSGIHLSKRIVPHTTLTRHLDGKTVYTIPQLLKEVKSPHYDPPDVEADYVVLGIIASKSTPLNHKKKYQKTSNGDPDEEAEDDQAAGRAKFMVLRLSDLHWELDMYLFATGFSEFWKLTVGTVVAILNPGIMPPKNKDTGNFSLKLSSSEDSVIEIGSARDLGFCNAVKKDGKQCGSWVDLRKTKVCEFHVSLAIEKTKSGRMEVNTMTGFGSRSGGGSGMFGLRKGAAGTKRSDELKREGMFRDRSIHETVYIAPSAAKILDDEDMDFGGGIERTLSRAEQSRKRFADKEKERELARKLGQMGTGLGGEYMRRKVGDVSGYNANTGSDSSRDGPKEKTDAASLGLLNRKASDVSLAHANKRKRVLNSGSEAVGWGGAYRRGLPSPIRKPEVRQSSPVKKKARFILEEKGIRLPGRESLGGRGNTPDDDDDDDGLEII
ncbi:hypothetical protein EJ05DRAFT_473851 [Pseudovirgaria hyperparasitica]|uniref:Uncharacterized protein n=1 Tax=Pseudovirgaria hyperparasitica TaxID=470096 RepID=A0A6A6WGJ0_9PEZI|nr:uncharacterized protein EJ05DRAFT_473851 [Pseudovirgaria hyperparasitica]KAF2761329.1 hypothetical protein EJ05DRAFT_473851 [Pseudovirgaria hyperparasitica]